MLVGDTLPELRGGIHRGIDFPAKNILGIVQCGDDVSESHVSNDHEIDVAVCTGLSAGGGSIYEGNVDAADQWKEHCPQDGHDSIGLDQQCPEFLEYRAVLVGSEQRLIPLSAADEKPRRLKRLEFSE